MRLRVECIKISCYCLLIFEQNVYIRVIKVLTDLAADLTQDVLLGTDQRLLKPFFDILKNRGEGISQN